MFARIFGVVMATWLAFPAAVATQQDDGRGPQLVPVEAQALIFEMQQIQERLRPIQQEAMQDPALQAAGDSLGALIREAMVEVEPATPSLIERLNVLMPELEAAQAAGDRPRFDRAIAEASEIDQILQIAQATAVERPDVSDQVDAFEARVHRRMIDNSPEVADLLARLEVLTTELSAMLSVGL